MRAPLSAAAGGPGELALAIDRLVVELRLKGRREAWAARAQLVGEAMIGAIMDTNDRAS